MDYIKAEQVGAYKWRVLAIPFGGQFKGSKDADGEFFSERTDIKPEWFDRRPVIWHHGMDPHIKDATIGFEDDLEMGRDGWWANLWLTRGQRYVAEVERMLRGGKAYGSSGAISHLVRIDRRSGEILVWPHAEQTLTTTPINLLSRLVPTKAIDYFDEAGIDLSPAVRGLLIPDLDSPTDLSADLPTGGDAEATRRRLGALADAEALRTRLMTI